MKLYYCPRTRAARALWMLEETELPYEIEFVNVMAHAQTPEFLKINPMGKVPALVDEGVVVTESVAVCAYLADKAPEKNLAPPVGSPLRGAYYRWLFFAAGVLEPAFIQKSLGWTHDRSAMVGWGTPELMIETLKAEIPADGWLVGDHFTAADLLIGGNLSFMARGGLVDLWPEAKAYAERITARPAGQRAMAKDTELAEKYLA